MMFGGITFQARLGRGGMALGPSCFPRRPHDVTLFATPQEVCMFLEMVAWRVEASPRSQLACGVGVLSFLANRGL